MNIVRIVIAVLLLGVCPFIVWAGEVDDSPGLGGIGMILGLIGLYLLVRPLLRRRAGSAATRS